MEPLSTICVVIQQKQHKKSSTKIRFIYRKRSQEHENLKQFNKTRILGY